MDERVLKWLFDIKITIGEIDSYFENQEKNFFKYHENIMLKSFNGKICTGRFREPERNREQLLSDKLGIDFADKKSIFVNRNTEYYGSIGNTRRTA